MEMILGCQTEHCLNRLSSPPIAAIIKNGLTGPQIADLLHISPDTVRKRGHCLTAKIDTKVTARRFKGIGKLFGLSYSAVSPAVKSLKARMLENQELTAKFNDFYSQFKL
jgi:hypothetical protein